MSGLRGAPAGTGAAGGSARDARQMAQRAGDASGSNGDASGSKGCSDAEERVLAFFWCGPRTRWPSHGANTHLFADAACPISTGRGMRRVHLVRGGGGAIRRPARPGGGRGAVTKTSRAAKASERKGFRV